ncbi:MULTISPECIES: family 4 glycosyl hydrolase [Bacillaceae]|uniref:family 4 glycosyl hydrolase n=1 Tax=Bacillaceae TaxID=186817 RepID=UPI000BFD5ACC|nr:MULTISPECIES: alpha-glucosidase/alpha-galactosidase [Bacillaceae]PGT84880.1 alpha-glucosidase/alpha-galactosidase [Bacillus sp. AFS040349]UGB32052.1 alpha-glucosidase/alpha-galactosidase [Metabacillus sp. B2-18]
MTNLHSLKIAYIGGGSKSWARSLMNDLALESRISGTVSLYDLNYDAAVQNAKIGNQISQLEEAKSNWKYEAVSTMEEALSESDFVIISILPGSFEEMASDVHTPEKYGVYQSVGDTVGPGGFVRALRTIPMYVEIANSIKQHAKDAWVINYTNPMSLCTRTLYEVFPEIKAFGCCHEVFETQNLLAEVVKEFLNEEVAQRSDIKVNVLGINHFTWVNQASYQNIDLIPYYQQFAEKYAETGFEKEEGSWKNSVFSSCQRVKFDLFKKYGVIAAAGDRHLAEFMPPIYLKDPETVSSWKFHLTSVDFRKENLIKRISENEELAEGNQKFEIYSSGEEGVKIILALLGVEEVVTNVNYPNKGQIEGLPIGAIVETNALFRNNTVQPVFAGKLPLDIHNMVHRHVLNQESTLQAALTKDKQLALNTFVNEPLLTVSREEAEELFDEMLKNTKDYLPGWAI